MANYSYISLPEKLTADEIEALLKRIVQGKFGDRVEVVGADWEPELGCTHVWVVRVPNSAAFDEEEAKRRWLAPGEGVGFSVQRKRGGSQLVFRHGPDPGFVSWLRGCVAERIANEFGVGILYDATDKVEKRGPRAKNRYDYPTYFEYLTRNFKKPLPAEDAAWLVQRFKEQTPEGWWTGP